MREKKYYKTPEGKIKRATTVGTVLAGPIGGIIAGLIANKKLGSIQKDTLDKGRQYIKKRKNTKIDVGNKTKKLLESAKYDTGETDEQKIIRLRKEGKVNPNAHHFFDQNGNLIMVTWDD